MKVVSTDTPGEGAAEVSQGNDALFLSFFLFILEKREKVIPLVKQGNLIPADPSAKILGTMGRTRSRQALEAQPAPPSAGPPSDVWVRPVVMTGHASAATVL